MIETQQSISEWAEETFGPASNLRIAKRAAEELLEVFNAVDAGENAKAVEEVADVVIVLSRLVSQCGGNLADEIQRKMALNRARTWRVDGTGCGYHVKGK